MRYYESLYIVNPNFEQGKLEEVMKTVTETISEYGFKTINHFVWGKKRLAYNIQEHKYGSYVLLHFETESTENLDNFERFMVLQKPILRNQTVALEEKPSKQTEKASSRDEEQKDLSEDRSEKREKSSNEDRDKETEADKVKESEEKTKSDEPNPEQESEEQAEKKESEENQ